MGKPANLMAATFSFYFGQAGAGLCLMFVYVLVHGGAMRNLMVGLVTGGLVVMCIVGLGLMTGLSLGPQRERYIVASVPAFVLLYVTGHIGVGGPPGPGLFGGMVFAALAHLLMVWLLWPHDEEGPEAQTA